MKVSFSENEYNIGFVKELVWTDWLIPWALAVDEETAAVIAVGRWLQKWPQHAAVIGDQSPMFNIWVLTWWHQ